MNTKAKIVSLIAVIAVAALVIITAALYTRSPDGVAVVTLSTLTPAIEPVASVSPTPAGVKFPIYSGDPIQNIGSDPLMNQLPAEVVEREKKYLAGLAASLEAQPVDYNNWIGVGVTKKLFSNYLGARDAWEYAKLVSPTHPLAYLNLADLYGYFLKDFSKAEENYLAAVANDNVNIHGSYYAIANFYRDFGFKDKAIEYYTKLLEFMPNDPAVLVELERLGVTR